MPPTTTTGERAPGTCPFRVVGDDLKQVSESGCLHRLNLIWSLSRSDSDTLTGGTNPSSGPGSRVAQQGFTLVELVVVLLLVGILAAVGMPRFFNQLSFQEWGFSDELGEALRFGQKLAIATGCDTQVAITAGSYHLSQRVTCNSGAFTTPVRQPGSDGTGYAGNAPGGVALTVTSLYFDALGRPHDSASGNLLASAVNIAIGSRSVSVEPQTGYVH